MRKDYKLFLLIVLSFVFISLEFISASTFGIDSATPRYINRTINTLINFTINNTGTYNITEVIIQLPRETTFYANSNGTDAVGTSFTNSSSMGVISLNWTNLTAKGFIENASVRKNFWFNASFSSSGDKNFTVKINDTALEGNSSLQVLTINFEFSGYVKNETGGFQNATNVTIYQFIEGQNSPPTELIVGSVLTDANGSFRFASVNGSASNYELKTFYKNSSGNVTKTGTVLPPFPANMYYPMSGFENFDMSLNGSTFYLQPAATLRLYAYNSSNDLVNFGYEVIDQKIGFPIVSNVMGNVQTVDVVVPAGKEYTVMMLRDFSQFGNDASPPISNSSLGTINAGDLIIVNQSLAVSSYRLYGCVNLGSGVNNSLINVTNIKLKLAPWSTSSGMFIPPMDAAQGNINLSDSTQLNNSDSRCPSGIAWYNISVLGSASGITYLLEMYAKNASDESGNPANANNLATFQNISITGNRNFNLTLYKLAGAYYNDSVSGVSSLNTSQMKISIINETGGAITTSMHIEVSVKNSNAGTGTVNYMVESLTNGVFYLPILNNSDWAKVSVFPDNSPPMEKTLNLSINENNITLISIEFGEGGDKGLRQMNSSGQLENINASTMPIQLRFLRRGTQEVITSMNASDFNPLKALVAGNVDLEIKIIATNVTMKFNNFDMFSAKQPPMFAVMDNNSMNSTDQSWKFGNFVPKDVYDNVTLIIPYTNNINESWNYNMSIPLLYKEDPTQTHQLQVAWNSSAGYTTNNLTDEFIDYNNSRYRDYLTSQGVACSTTLGSVCYWDKTNNNFEIEIPHFSGISPSVAGSAPSSSTASSSGGGGASAGTVYWEKTFIPSDSQFKEGYTNELKVKERIKIKILNESHYVGITELTSTTATINISSTPQQAVLKIGDIRKFDVTNDQFYDLSVKLDLIKNSKANVTIKSIHEKITEETKKQEEKKEEKAVKEKQETITNKKSLVWLWIIISIIIVLIIGIIIYKFRKN